MAPDKSTAFRFERLQQMPETKPLSAGQVTLSSKECPEKAFVTVFQ
jgi:hypothetical protein